MSSILKALRRVEEEVASEAERDLREQVVARRVRPPASPPAARRGVRLTAAGAGLLAVLALGFALGRWLSALPPVPVLERVARTEPPPAESAAATEAPRPAATPSSAASPAPFAASAAGAAGPTGIAAVPATAPAPAAAALSAPAPVPAPIAAPPPAAPVVAVVAPPLPAPTGAFVDDGEPLGSDDPAALPDPATEPSSRERFQEDPPPRVRARPAAPPTTKLEAIAAPLRRPPPPPQPSRAAPASRTTAPRVASTVWHPDGERRRAMVQVDGAPGPAREVREGETVGAYLVLAIGPTGVVFRRDGADVTRRVGQP